MPLLPLLRFLLALLFALAATAQAQDDAVPGASTRTAGAPLVKQLRYPFPIAESNFDPAQISDL